MVWRMTSSALLLVICSVVVSGATDTVTGGFAQKRSTCSAESGECNESSLETVSKVVNLIEDAASIANLDNIGMVGPFTNLMRIKNNIETGNIKAGVVGLANSGKSTFLNALLGKRYLPTSVQAQTAKEVSIVHTPRSPGELYTSRDKNEKPTLIATGQDAITKELKKLNEKARENEETFEKLSLHAPILFLEGIETVNFEVSDTPGLYEAAAGEVSVQDAEIAVKELCAFILILNVNFLKWESEADIITALKDKHPELFSKLSRILVLVNAYDITYYDNSPENLKAEGIPSYVAKYLSDPDIADIKIPPTQIIPFSAKWALYSRIWSADPERFLESKSAKLLYEEAAILMQRANYEGELKPFEEVTVNDVKEMCTFLLEFSHIRQIEKRLNDMLYTNSLFILLEAAIDDSIAEMTTINGQIDAKIAEQNIGQKEALLSCQESLLSKFSEFESKAGSVKHPPVPMAEITSITETLRGTFRNKFNMISSNHLANFYSTKDKNSLFDRIYSIKPLLTSMGNTELKASWNSISTVVRQKYISHASSILSDTKTSLLVALTNFARENPLCDKLALMLSEKHSTEIGKIDTNTLVPSFPAVPFHVDGNVIPNANLEYIEVYHSRSGKTRKMKGREYHGKGKGRGGGRRGKRKGKGNASFSPDLPPIQQAITSGAINPWVQSFQSNVENTVKSVSNQLVQSLAAAKRNSLLSAKTELEKAVETSRQSLKHSQDAINELNASKNTLVKLQNDLKSVQ